MTSSPCTLVQASSAPQPGSQPGTPGERSEVAICEAPRSGGRRPDCDWTPGTGAAFTLAKVQGAILRERVGGHRGCRIGWSPRLEGVRQFINRLCRGGYLIALPPEQMYGGEDIPADVRGGAQPCEASTGTHIGRECRGLAGCGPSSQVESRVGRVRQSVPPPPAL